MAKDIIIPICTFYFLFVTTQRQPSFPAKRVLTVAAVYDRRTNPPSSVALSSPPASQCQLPLIARSLNKATTRNPYPELTAEGSDP